MKANRRKSDYNSPCVQDMPSVVEGERCVIHALTLHTTSQLENNQQERGDNSVTTTSGE